MKKPRILIYAIRLMYKNMWLGRSRKALFALALLALLTSFSSYRDTSKVSTELGIVTLSFSLSMWFIGLPAVLLLIDLYNNPKRVERVSSTLPEHYG